MRSVADVNALPPTIKATGSRLPCTGWRSANCLAQRIGIGLAAVAEQRRLEQGRDGAGGGGREREHGGKEQFEHHGTAMDGSGILLPPERAAKC